MDGLVLTRLVQKVTLLICNVKAYLMQKFLKFLGVLSVLTTQFAAIQHLLSKFVLQLQKAKVLLVSLITQVQSISQGLINAVRTLGESGLQLLTTVRQTLLAVKQALKKDK